MIKENSNDKVENNSSNESLKFTQDIIWVGISQAFTAILGVLAIPALTKVYSSEIYGIWTQVSATVALAAPILTLQFGTSAVRFLSTEENKAQRRRSLGTMLTGIFIFAILLLIFINLWASQLSIFLFANSNYSNFVRLTYFWTFTEAIFTFLMSYLRARRQIKSLAVIQIFFSFFKIAAIVTLAKIGLDLEWITTSIILIELLFVVFIFYIIIKEEGYPQLNFGGMRQILAFSLPQVPSGFLLWIINTSDRFFITHFLGLSQTGIYATSSTLGILIYLLFTPISFVLFPAVSKVWEQKRKTDVKVYFEYSTKLFLTLAIPTVAGVTLLSQPLLKILATSEYLVGSQLVLLIAIGTVLLGIYQINLYIIYLVQQTKWLPLIILISSSISAGINYIVIPKIGIMGAAVSNIVSYFVLAGIVTMWSRKTINYSLDAKYILKIIAASIGMATSVYFLKPSSIGEIILVIFIGLIIYTIILILLKAFSNQDKKLMRQIFTTLMLWMPK